MKNKSQDISKYYITSKGDFYKMPVEEQETIISFDYEQKNINIFTNRPPVLKRLISILGEPNENNIMGGSWYVSFDDRKLVRKIFSMNLYLTRKK